MDSVQKAIRRPFGNRIVRYIISGGAATAINFGTLLFLTEVMGIWYLLSSIAGVSVGFVTSFVLQKFWTFQNRSLERVYVQFPLHIALSLANIAVNTALLYALVEYLHLWYLLAQFLIAGGLAVMNYAVYRLYIFTHHEQA